MDERTDRECSMTGGVICDKCFSVVCGTAGQKKTCRGFKLMYKIRVRCSQPPRSGRMTCISHKKQEAGRY